MSRLSIENFPNGVQIYQDEDLYKFTKDAIDLAKFCNIKHSDSVLELCAGSGVISLYCYSLTAFNKLYLNEIQPEFCDLLDKNLELNNLTSRAKILNCDLSELKNTDFDKKVDVIICNPPYFKYEGQKINESYSSAIARHEILTNLSKIILKAAELLKDRGKFYLMIPATRTAECISKLVEAKLEPKRIKFLSNGKSEYYLSLIEAVLNGKSGVKIIV